MDFLGILFFDRFPEASRDDLGNAALAYCRVLVSKDGVNFARFYWSGSNRIAIIIATDSRTMRHRDARVGDVEFGCDAVPPR